MHVCSFIGLLSLAIVQSSRADDFTPIVAPVHGECRSFAADSIDVGTTAAPPVVVIQQAVKLTSQQCWWKLVAPPGRRLLVHVTYGVCSAVANSRFDIYEYVGGAQRHLLDTCNEMQSVYITSQTNAVVIYLKGEPAAVYQGFEAFVEAYSVYNSVGMKMLSPQSTTVPVAPSMGTMRTHTDGVNESTATPSILTSEVSSGSAISAPAETVAPPARGGKLFMVVASVAAAVAVLLIVGLTAYIVITRRRNKETKVPTIRFNYSTSEKCRTELQSQPPPGGRIQW
ncbi:PREDICTED: uncharacterized protein LOC106817163 [Priapulus caudatus]|uniref:Uncharacterized protein LOC106817163 n=1 Tax=Priapulus caudatus TaxID=37621 RepID=A0ABM1EYN2_PRICU|nr:PREDICTED: uncharacterized protein LOC106817163 [Priapulus caudatus]